MMREEAWYFLGRGLNCDTAVLAYWLILKFGFDGTIDWLNALQQR